MMILSLMLMTVPDAQGLRVESPLQTWVDARKTSRVELPAGLITGPLLVDRDLHLVGAGVGRTLLDGARRHSVVAVMPGVKLTMEDLTVQNGAASMSTPELPREVARPWMYPAAGGGVRALAGARVELRRVAIVNCGAAVGGTAIALGEETVGILEDVHVKGYIQVPGASISVGSVAVEALGVKQLHVRGLRFEGAAPDAGRELMFSVRDEALLANVSLGERSTQRCAPRVWMSGPQKGPSARIVMDGWTVLEDGCPVVFVGKNADVVYARMKWPDAEVPARVRAVERERGQ